MAAVLPVLNTTVCEILNLPAKAGITSLINKHAQAALAWLEGVIPAEADEEEGIEVGYAELTEADPDVDAQIQALFEACYSYKMLNLIAPLLNLNTAGTGIITSTGFEASRTSLLSLDEVKKLQALMEEKALRTVEPYLNDAGVTLLAGFERATSTRMRVAVIKEEDEDLWS